MQEAKPLEARAAEKPSLRTPDPIERPELFIALVGPIGTDLDCVCEALDGELGALGYATVPIKLSSCLHRLGPYEALRDVNTAADHIVEHMDAGDALRRQLRHGGALAALAVAEVKRLRESSEPRPATAFVFRSLKHPDEIELLRAIYGPLLFVLSLYEDAETRHHRLEQRLERDTPSTAHADAERLMKRDETGTGEDRLGQDVQNTFPKADYFLDGSRRVEQDVKRFVRLMFGDHEQGPTKGEYAMAMAHVAARRSADLSRQVGAAIMDADGEVLTTGCNEVPRCGGGVYWSGDEPDGRDIAQGRDPNAIMGNEILREIFTAFQHAGYLSETLSQTSSDAFVKAVKAERVLERSRVSSLVEFGRVVHAEMNALSHAARRGVAVAGAALYCSTFPCHGCARHVLAAGIAEVIYIEPYPKSLAQALYPEAIRSGGEPDAKRLVFRPFTGVAPARFLEWFSFGKRKDADGYAVRFDTKAATPRVRSIGYSHRTLEAKLCDELSSCLERHGLLEPQDAA